MNTYIRLAGFHLEIVDLVVFLAGLCLGAICASIAVHLPKRLVANALPQDLVNPRKSRIAFSAVAFLVALSCLFFVQSFGLNVISALHIIVASHLCILAGTDVLYRLLPNKIMLSGVISVLALRTLTPSDAWHTCLANGIFGAGTGFALLLVCALIKPGAIGGGDIKMAGFIGFHLGLPLIMPGLALSFILASVYCLPMLAAKRLRRTDAIPFGVFLSLAALLTIAAP